MKDRCFAPLQWRKTSVGWVRVLIFEHVVAAGAGKPADLRQVERAEATVWMDLRTLALRSGCVIRTNREQNNGMETAGGTGLEQGFRVDNGKRACDAADAH